MERTAAPLRYAPVGMTIHILAGPRVPKKNCEHFHFYSEQDRAAKYSFFPPQQASLPGAPVLEEKPAGHPSGGGGSSSQRAAIAAVWASLQKYGLQ